MLTNAKSRYPENFTLTLEYIIAGILAGFCPMTGIKFDLTNEHEKLTGRSRNPYGPSIDRIDSRLGYSNENCRVVSMQYNLMKAELSDNELIYICRLIVEKNS